MSVIIRKDGWEVAGETLDDLELGIRVVQRAIENAKTIALPVREIGEVRRRGRPASKNRDSTDRLKASQNKRIALEFLRLLVANPGGIETGDLVKKMALQASQAISGVTQKTDKLLQEVGLQPESVYGSVKAPATAPRKWLPMERISEAISAIEQLSE